VVIEHPIVSGAANGSPGVGTGTPSGPMSWWIGHIATI
jgi:hypothetical protein